MEIAVGADHLGYPLKQALADYLRGLHHDVVDFGCDSTDPVDYPDVAIKVAEAVAAGRFERAILICGTGIGMAITANKVPGVRAASVSDPYSAERARKSNVRLRMNPRRGTGPVFPTHGPMAHPVPVVTLTEYRNQRQSINSYCWSIPAYPSPSGSSATPALPTFDTTPPMT